MGDEASEEVELGKREWPRNENVGVTGDGQSEDVDDCDKCNALGRAIDSGDSILPSESSFFLASTNCGNLSCRSSRMIIPISLLRGFFVADVPVPVAVPVAVAVAVAVAEAV